MTRTDIINHLIKKYGYKRYLEIGVHNPNNNFNLIKCEIKTGVDPDPYTNTTHIMTSDEFFAANKWQYDLIFIDGLHHAEQVKTDVENAIGCLSKGGVIVIHDCNPPTKAHQIVPFEDANSQEWTGDVWKAWVSLRQMGFETKVLDCDWGVGILRPSINKKVARPNKLTYENFEKNRTEWLNLVPASFDQL